MSINGYWLHCENSLHHHAHVKGNWLIALMYLSVSDIEYYTCVYPRITSTSIYSSIVMLLLTLHIFITHLMAKYLSSYIVCTHLLGSYSCIETLQYICVIATVFMTRSI